MTTARLLTDAALERITAATNGHEPGQPYFLSREQFSRFWREELCDEHARDPRHSDRVDLWVAIASAEARRQFDPGWSRCHSELAMDTEQSGNMQWWYQTTSGTQLFALDWRDSDPQGSIHWSEVLSVFNDVLQWSTESRNPEDPWAPIGSDGFYAVAIPAERDQPGRTAWTQVRLAIAGLDYRSWIQEQDGDYGDEIGIARRTVKQVLRSAA
jgi:hypothetical protein